MTAAKVEQNQELERQVDDLLRSDKRLAGAAELIGRIAVVVKLVPLKAKPKPLPPQAWLKVARPSRYPEDKRATGGVDYQGQITIDQMLWNRLEANDRRAALVWALRGFSVTTDEDDNEVVTLERPPLQTWSDVAPEHSSLVAAFREDPALAALDSDAAERLGLTGLHALIRDLRATIQDLCQGDLDGSGFQNEYPTLAARVRKALGEPDPDDTEQADEPSFAHDEDDGPEENEGQS